MWYEIKGLKVSEQADAVLAYLKGEWSIEGVEDCNLYLNTAAWYNGRERGYSVTAKVLGSRAAALVITFAEHRNSDDIFVDHWRQNMGINPPTKADFTDKAYEQRQMFRYGNAHMAAGYIRGLIERYAREIIKEADDA